MATSYSSKTGPAFRYTRGKLVDGYIEVTGEYLGFRPIGDPEQIGFLQWNEFKSIKFLKANMLRPAIIQVSRVGSNAPLLLAVSDPDAWISLITDAYNYSQHNKPDTGGFSVRRNQPAK